MIREIRTGKPIARIRSTCRWTYRKLHLLVLLQCFTCILTQVEADLLFTIREEQPARTVVGKISECSDYSCSFDGNPAPFTIDSGVIKSTVKIDRDVLTVNPIVLNVRSSNPNIHPPKVQIQVEDINDNIPKFPSLYYTLQIAETTTAGTVYPINTATDSDLGNNGTIDYSIVAGNGDRKFTLGIGSFICQQAAELCIITNNTLDRETTPFYQLKVSASDQGIPSLTGFCLVNITILDSNDNVPVFTSGQFSGSIAENTKPGQSILTVSATDKDIGLNGEIEYSIERDAENSDQTFHVDSNTGVIRTKGSLDYEDKKFYRFTVIASDKGQPKESATAGVTVNIIDENDNYPYISLLYDPILSSKAIVSEDCQIPTTLIFVRVSDNDGSKPNNEINLVISKGNELGYFIVQPHQVLTGAYSIQVGHNLDREKAAYFNLTLSATDKGNPSRTTLAFAIVEVLDVNDNEPKFSSNLYTASVNEHAPNGSYVFKVNASDPDAGSNGTLSYSITSGNDRGWFQIDSQSGLVTTVMKMDRELYASISLTISAQDHGSSPKTGKTRLKINILDANDNRPKFSKSVYRESIPEDATRDRVIATLNATDSDIGINAKITFAIDTNSPDILKHFELDSSSGVLKLKATVDREIKSVYTIPVIATDNGTPKLSSKASVVVMVTDINDNNPIFYPVVYFVSVVENERPGFLVKVTATDKDEGSNGKVIYSIKSGNSNNSFDINSSTGEIRTIKSLDHEANGFHKLEITSKDGGGNVALKPAFVEVTVINQADNPPYFEHSVYNFSVYENAPKGTLVGKVFAKTKDKNDTITYEIISGDPGHLFIVDGSGGIIMVNGAIDREEKNNFWLDIVAKTGKTKPLSAKTSVDISVLDKNDNAPKFTKSIMHVDILGTWPAGKLISDAAATDNDAGSNGIVRYQLTKNANGLFRINTTSGEVTLARKVTENDNSQYTVQIMASDLGSPPLHSTLTIQANILINHPPKFRSNSYVTHVLASRPLSYRFLIVNAVDGDSGKDGQLSYSIDQLGNQEGLFGIFPDGMLYIKKNLIHATKASYDIVVRATDGGNPSLSASVSVTIYIQDSDEHRTLFTNNTFRFSIAENLAPGSSVGTVTARATDKSKTKDIIYSVLGSNNIFAIDAKSGLITTRLSLDRESLMKESGGSNYIMRAEAVYNDTTVRRDSAIVIVTVTDVNDNPPIFSSALYSVKVNEKLVPVAVVYKVTAVDPDSSENANFTYSIIKGTGKGIFHIDKSSGNLYLDKPLDRESVDSYTLTLQATDILNSSLFSQSVVQISVEDSNDERPVFQSFSNTIKLRESLPVGSEIIDLNATDKDIGQNGQITYSITCGNLDAVFDINHSTGKVFLTKHLDYETKTKYQLCFVAQDRGIPPLSSAANLTIHIIDVNDNTPVFASSPQQLQILENVTIGTEIGRCSATDKDAGTYGQIVFSLDKQVPKGNIFSVNPHNCAITTIATVNREDMPDGKSYFQLVVKATDKAIPVANALSATKVIIVLVQDVNDNRPRFISPPAAHVGSSTFIMNVKAVDLDAGANGMVTYNFISSGSSGSLFYLDRNTGQLDKVSQLNDNNLLYKRTIRAEDGGRPPLADRTEITLFKIGGSGPIFTNSTFQGIITENLTPGATVLRVRAYYSSSQSNSKIKYYMTADNSKGALKVNEVTGEVVTKQKIDRESLGTVLRLVVYAVDMQGPNPRTSSTNVVINVVDVNDNTPEFSNDRYTVSIDESARPSSGVITLTATDSDEGDNAKITYSITGGLHRNMFKIDSHNGKVTTQGRFDHEKLSLYTINVTARDHGHPSLSSTCLVTVRINDVNDNAPIFTKAFYSFKISEDALIGTTVGIVRASDIDTGDNARLTYSIVGADRDIFELNPSSGVLTLSQKLDRETVEHYVLNIVATDNGKSNKQSTSVEVYVTVLDTNDNSPEFKRNGYYGDIVEGAIAYTPVVTVVALDRDSGTNGVVKYSILSGNTDNSFGILDNGTIVNLKVLDREFQDGYILTVQATDQATPLSARRRSTTRVTINVTDINDNKPYFTSASVAHVSESARIGDAVLTVIAVDLDQGSNSQLTYTLTKIDLSAPFTLGPTDGVLRVSGGLDRETKENFTIKVTATDTGNPTLSSDMKIVIVVDDFNDHAPVFLQHPKEVLIFENVSVGTDVLKFSAVDQDSVSNAEVRYEIVTGNDNGAFFVNSITGRLRTAKLLDRETTPKQVLEIRAYDLGVPRKSSVTTVTIVLRDINDNSPVFTKDTYVVDVQEDVIDSNIVTVVAQDNDEGSDGDVTYRISSGDVSGLFVINSKTGAIGLTSKLDRERKDKYELTIEAKDGGSPRLLGTCHVVIKVMDKNDNPPVFQPKSLEAKVPEGAAVGTFVVQVTALDKDSGANADLTYSLVNNYARFKIDPKSGRIVTDNVLNREQIAHHPLEVVATDAGNPSLQGKATVDVVVEDSNDHDPVFENPLIKATVQENAGPGVLVAVVSASDQDTGINAESDYTITSGDSNAIFNLAKETGVLYVSKQVPSSPSTYTLQIKAANRNDEKRVATATVQVFVSKGSFPRFLHGDQILSISELTPIGTKLITVNATGHTGYFIAGGDSEDAFHVDAVFGILKIKHSLDYEKQKNYTVIIGAKDGSNPAHVGFVKVHIIVQDENDNAPVFSQSVYRADIKEGLPANSPVLTISASDADSGFNAQMKYSVRLTDGGVSPFGISPTTAQLFTKQILDRESKSSYSLTVRAENVGNKSISSEAVVLVTVTDVNDNAPVFVSVMSVKVLESVSVGTVVAVLKADDEDSSYDSPLHYEIQANTNKAGVFVIDSSTGNISLAKTLDRESQSTYTLGVFVNDSKHVIRSTLNVTVLDVNDDAPKFAENLYSASLPESSPVGFSIMNVTASDADIGTNAEIAYSIVSTQPFSYFSIDQKLGIISLHKVVKFQQSNSKPNPNVFTLAIRAQNVYSPYLKGDTRVDIEVLDTNDHAPVFKRSSYRFTAVVDSGTGVSIGRVQAEDKYDYGPNAEIFYEVSSGNGTAKFRMVPETGDVRVKSDLNSDANKVYCIIVKAKDKGSPSKESTAQVCVDVTPKNLYAPKFSRSVYRMSASEDQAVGSVIVQVTATDDDTGKNGKISYRIASGNDKGYFGIGETNGSIYVAKPLDYEYRPKYVLDIVATDGGKLSKSTTVPAEITLLDVNDNNPVFDPVTYRCKLPENTPALSKVVCKVHATDKDRQGKQDVRYYIADDEGRRRFRIDNVTGEIKATREFDLETTAKTSLFIGAKDLGRPPQRFADPRASVTIIITGKNEFVPVFAKDKFEGTVAENAPIGHSVLRVSATDKDDGADGIVVYHLIGADNNKGFTLNTETGVLSISGNLDSEKAGNVTLKVIAKNLFQTDVTPHTVGHATIIVTVTDANDAPRFLKSLYDAKITEGVPKGSYVTNVTAVDDDKDTFLAGPGIRYGIAAGDTNGAFTIDVIKGIISTAGELDRELIPVYKLSVTATDNGSPPMTGNATVVVTLRDINDNPPVLVTGDRVASVLENQPTGTIVITLRAEDPDSNPHRGPYTFDISGTNYGKFHLDKNTGLLKTTAMLDREAKSSYNLSVRITDSGGLSAVSYCLVTVKDQNDNRPKATARVVKVNTYDRRFPGGAVANIRPEDADVDDVMSCSLIRSSCNFVAFQRGDCMISSKPNTGDSLCLLRINGSDGIGSVRYNVTLTFTGYTTHTVKHSVAVRLQKTAPRAFLITSYHSFSQAVLRILPNEYSSLQIVSIKGFDRGFVDVLIAARKPNTFTYLAQDKLSELLKLKESQVQSEGKVDVYRVDYTPCLDKSPCKNGAECSSEVQATGNTFVVNTVPIVFVSADFNWRYLCRCKPGFTGSTCDINMNDCDPSPCINGGTCTNDGSTFKCSCPAGYTGRICQVDIDECSSSPCKHSTGCINTVGSYSCQCIPGYSGKNCDFKVDYCQGSPCMYNSTCVAQLSSFKCICDFGGRGSRCQHSSLGFGVVSYMKFKTIRSSKQDTYNNITLSFATSSPDGLLLYNSDGTTSAAGDFVALEMVEGKIRFAYNLGYSKNAAVVQVDRVVNDGAWHHVVVIRDKVTAEVVVDYNFKRKDSVAGQFTKLELNSSPLYVGGVQDFDRVLNDPRMHIRAYDFVGCIRDFYNNGHQVLYKDALGSSGAMDHCPHSAYCSTNPCKHDGKCVDTWFGYYCQCANGHSGKNCEKAETDAVRFSASSSLVLEFKESYRREQKLGELQSATVRIKRAVSSSDESFGISFRTFKGGLILLAQDDTPDYTLIQVSSQTVHYEFKSGNTIKNITTVMSSVMDGLWHNVTLRRQDATVTFTVDDVEKQQTFTVKPHRFLGPNVRKWSLGGASRPPPGVTVSNFNGCMEQLKIDGVNVPLNGANGYLVSKPQGGAITQGCGEKNGACTSNPCLGNTERPACIEDWYGYACVSNEPCTPNPCYNNGTCNPRKDGSFRCVCHANFSGEVCGICHGYPCVMKETRVKDSPYSIGLIAGILFLVVVIVGIIVGVLAVKRHQKLKRESDYDAKHCDDICIPAGDIQDGSHRASPSHSSDDSGVVIRNPSQKSNQDLRTSPNDDNKNIVIHKMGPPEDYQLKLHKSDEKIDHGFSESDVGEFIIKNDYAPRTGSRERLDHVIYPRRTEVQQHSTPIERNQQRGTPRQRPRTRDRRPPSSLARQVLDRRHNGPPKTESRMRPHYGHRHHKRRSNSIDTTSSDEQHDLSDGAPKSDIDNSEMLDYYDIEVASIGVSEASYQYDPSMFKDSGARRDMPGFSQSEIDRIRQSSRNPPSGSFLDAISSSSDEAPNVDKLSSLMERDDTSSESSDDTFTCSEFEFDEHSTARAEELDTHGSMIFSKLANAQATNPPRQPGSRTVSHSTINMSDDDLVITNRLAQKPPVNGVSEDFDWDDVLNWGLRYHNLRGVYKDIAELKDGQHGNGEEYV